LLSKFLFDASDATDEILAVYRAPSRTTGSTRAMGQWLVGFASGKDTGISQDRGMYQTLSIPVVLIWGEEDQTTLLAQGKTLSQLIPNSTLLTMPGVGHIPHIEDTAVFNERLFEALDFIANNQ
jgi:pimeloyl-ACP methyl ester carboxylesterase